MINSGIVFVVLTVILYIPLAVIFWDQRDSADDDGDDDDDYLVDRQDVLEDRGLKQQL